MFRREPFRTMAQVLDALDAKVLARTSFRFCGGTCLALAHGEYRLSRDLDFICSDPSGYADLRFSVREHGYDALFAVPRTTALEFPREVRADQYGLRFPVLVGATSIRVELIREARIALGPAEHAAWTSLPILSVVDAFAEKLLANSDRWADRDDLARLTFEERVSAVAELRRKWFGEDRIRSRLVRVLASADLAPRSVRRGRRPCGRRAR